MAIPNALKFLFDQTITIAPRTGRDGYGKPTFGAAKSYNAKIERSSVAIRDDEQREIASPRKIYLFTQDVIGLEDKLTLPASHAPTQPKILGVAPVSDQNGVHHVVLTTE